MEHALFWHRIQFAFTITYHYLFPQLTMGLAWFLVYWKWRALRTGDKKYNQAARFWAKIFGLNFAVGVVTGIPMEFQFGTNRARFSRFAGGVVGHTLAMEGLFASSSNRARSASSCSASQGWAAGATSWPPWRSSPAAGSRAISSCALTRSSSARWATSSPATARSSSPTSGPSCGQPLRAFLGSCAFLTELLGATAACVFPVMLRSIGDPGASLTAYNASVPSGGAWWLPLAGGRSAFHWP